jgi:hypothetical protein
MGIFNNIKLSGHSVALRSLHFNYDVTTMILFIRVFQPQITQSISIKFSIESDTTKSVSNCHDRSNIFITLYKNQLEIWKVIYPRMRSSVMWSKGTDVARLAHPPNMSIEATHSSGILQFFEVSHPSR